MAVKLLLESVF